MVIFTQRVALETQPTDSVALTYHQRTKGRLKILTDGGFEAGIVIDRGDELQHGEKLSDANGHVLKINAQAEAVSVAETSSSLLFSKACYHMGNRHTEVQIESGRLVYLRDHVLDSMLMRLGLTVTRQMLSFSPENGAYSGGHSHAHGDDTVPHEH